MLHVAWATLLVVTVADAARAQTRTPPAPQPYPPQGYTPPYPYPYPAQPYPQPYPYPAQPYPQPYPYPAQPYPQPTPAQPYPQGSPQQPYPGRPAPQPPYAPPTGTSPYPSAPSNTSPSPSPSPSPSASERSDGPFKLSNALGASYGAAGGISFTRLAVDQGAEHRTWGGGMALTAAGVGHSSTVGAFGRGNFLLAGGGGGLEGMSALELYGTVGASATNSFHVSLGLGMAVRGVRNDEIDALKITLPAAMLGLQATFNGFGLAFGPTAGLALRTEYAPGDELQARRFVSRPGFQTAYGGSAILSTELLYAHAGVQRLAMTSPVTSGDGAVCLRIFFVAACAVGQVWNGIATQPLVGASKEIPSYYVGGLLGVGASGAHVLDTKD